MEPLHQALAEIATIRTQMARASEFRGYGPLALSLTGASAILAGVLQALWLPQAGQRPVMYVALWGCTALVCSTIIFTEAILRSRSPRSELANEMLRTAVAQFAPALGAGVVLTLVFMGYVNDALWMMPGLWQVIFSLGIFASYRFLPRAILYVALWYLASSMTCLAVGSGAWSFSPWLMALPFSLGQGLAAGVQWHSHRSLAGADSTMETSNDAA